MRTRLVALLVVAATMVLPMSAAHALTITYGPHVYTFQSDVEYVYGAYNITGRYGCSGCGPEAFNAQAWVRVTFRDGRFKENIGFRTEPSNIISSGQTITVWSHPRPAIWNECFEAYAKVRVGTGPYTTLSSARICNS